MMTFILYILAVVALIIMTIQQLRVYFTTDNNYLAITSRNIAIVLAVLCISLISILFSDPESLININQNQYEEREKSMQNELLTTAGNMVPLRDKSFH